MLKNKYKLGLKTAILRMGCARCPFQFNCTCQINRQIVDINACVEYFATLTKERHIENKPRRFKK